MYEDYNKKKNDPLITHIGRFSDKVHLASQCIQHAWYLNILNDLIYLLTFDK